MSIKVHTTTIRLKDSHSYITGYAVYGNGEKIGEAYKKRGFSYRGTNGWNSGIRLRDYHPIEWRYKGNNDTRDHYANSLKHAVERLVAEST